MNDGMGVWESLIVENIRGRKISREEKTRRSVVGTETEPKRGGENWESSEAKKGSASGL